MDRDVAKRWLQQNYNPEDRLAVVRIQRPSGVVRQDIRTVSEITDERYMSKLRFENAHDADVYVSSNALRPEATSRTKDDIGEVRHLMLDVDRDGPRTLDRLVADPSMPRPHHTLETSPGHYHAIYRVEGFTKEQAESLTRGLAHHFGTDPAAIDAARILRVPGFRHCKEPDMRPHHYVRDVLPAARRADRVWRPEHFPALQIERPEFGQAKIHMAIQPVKAGSHSQSHSDFAYACKQLESGKDPYVIEREISRFRSVDRETGARKSNPDYYAKITVNAARAKVNSRPLQSHEHVHSPSRGMER